MKKFLFLAMAAAAMVSCSQNEEIENAAQKAEIKLGTVVSNTTRATVTDLNALQGVGFTVNAYNTGTTKMTDVAAHTEMKSFMAETAEYKENAWSLSKSYYWPITGYIQFFAYGNPGKDAATKLVYNAPGTDNVYPSITYEVSDVTEQTDLVVATVVNANKTDNGTAGVSLTFQHALAQINFTLKGADAYTYTVRALSISGVHKKGTLSFDNLAAWNDLTADVATYNYTIDANGIELGAEGTAMDGAWMLMPQTLPDDAKINVTYDVTSTTEGIIAQGVSSNVNLKGTQDWLAGKKLRYSLTLSNAGEKIKMDVMSVNGWSATDDNTVYDPQQP